MKKKILSVFAAGVFAISLSLFAADGDLIVDGKVGIGTTEPGSTKLAVMDGSLGIGTTSPWGLFHVYGSGGSGFLANIENTGLYGLYVKTAGTSYGHDLLRVDDYYGPRFWVFGGGTAYIANSLGIGIMPPNEKLQVMGNVRANAYYLNSSRECKVNIADLSSQEALVSFMALKPVKYNFKEREINELGVEEIIIEESRLYMGFIAEDSPDFVTSSDKKSINLSNIVALLTKTVQEQQATIQEQEKRIQALEAKRTKK
ncbi:MAG: tail fiber domain-containing protein [Candidatus Omnitrophica bacterium]|nr:tail fiber domain-containing protein [Candidatus Omnitrophota bacterium]